MRNLKPYKQHSKKPLFTDEKEIELFIGLFNDFDNGCYTKIARYIFCEGMTNLETAEKTDYCVRQIERIRADILRVALKRAIEKLVERNDTKCKKRFLLF